MHIYIHTHTHTHTHTYIPWIHKCIIKTAGCGTSNKLLLLLLPTAIELSLGGSSPYTSTDKKIRINVHKRKNTKNTVQTIQNTVNISTRITKTSTHKYKI